MHHALVLTRELELTLTLTFSLLQCIESSRPLYVTLLGWSLRKVLIPRFALSVRRDARYRARTV